MNVIQMPLVDHKSDQELSKFHYARILDAMKEGVCLIDEKGEIQYVNDVYCQLFQIQKSKCLGKSIYKTVADDLTIRCLKTQTPKEGLLESADVSINVSAEPIFSDGKLEGVMSRYSVETGDQLCMNPASPLKLNDYVRENPFASFYITENQKLIAELIMAKKAAATDSTILILGESGTGKELISKGIHHHSKRRDQPFIAVNCGAIPANLIESELFGHEQGAFTGATKTKIGKFELANGGTIFLDEIGDLPLELQVKLLRVIQEMEIERVGAQQTQKIDVRIIAATHQDLEAMIEEGKFREDLYYRLNVIPIQLMPLRERLGDVKALVQTLSCKICKAMGLGNVIFESKAIEILETWQWRGNIRELENVVERAIVLCEGEVVTGADLPKDMRQVYEIYKSHQTELLENLEENPSEVRLNPKDKVQKFEDYERLIIQMAMDKHKSYNAAGKALGLTHKTVAAKVRKYGLASEATAENRI